MGWLRTWRINRAARAYALKLPKQLKAGWGFSEFYTPGQIKTSVKNLGLDANFIALGYAGFVPEDQFNLLRSEMPVPLSYQEARAAFSRYFPLEMWSAAWEPAGETPEAMESSGLHHPH